MAEQQVATQEKPEAPIAADTLWQQAQKDHVSTQADETPSADTKMEVHTAVTEDDGKTVDPLAGLPEPTRKLIEQINTKTAEQDANLKAANQKLATAHGTIGSLKKQLDDSLVMLRQMQPTVEAVKAQETAKEEAEATKKAVARKTAREKLADLLEPDELDAIFPEQPDVKPAEKPDVKPEQKETKDKQPAPSADDATQLRQILAVDDLHPGWRKEVKTPEFDKWVKAQPEAVSALVHSDDIDDADKLLTLYEQHKQDAAKVAKVEADRQARLRRGETVQGSGTAPQGTESTPDGLWEQAKRDRAKARAAA